VTRILWRQHEGRLGEVELARQGLHGPIGQPPRVREDRELVAPERGLREDVRR
jgi:hypothetical protein